MADSISINKKLSDEEIYKSLLPQIENLISTSDPVISSLANVTAALYEAFDKISWVGFYLRKDAKLFLGPFQGKIACVEIEIGKGVCGTAAGKRETVIVENVENFPGHIACDAGSKSEIVLPIIQDNELVAVLDLDSYNVSSFNEKDKFYLEKICDILIEKLPLRKFVLSAE